MKIFGQVKLLMTSKLKQNYLANANNWVIGSVILAGAILTKYIAKMWHDSQPNEWLLLIENGKMIRAGIGIKCFVLPTQSVVKFPSTIYKVNFSANNVTKEMQGVQISGFAIWSVFRDGEGPFKFYKYTQNGQAEENIRVLCESIVRHLIANMILKDLLQNRTLFRDQMREELQKQLSGWGVWLETVEINDVKICSKSLFEDLQAEFRQSSHLRAEEIRQQTQDQINQQKLISELNMTKNRAENETTQLKCENEQRLLRLKENSEFSEQENTFKTEKLKQENQIEMLRLSLQFELEKEKLKQKNELTATIKQFEMDWAQKFLEQDKLHTPITLQKYLIDSTERIYNRLPIQDIKINTFGNNSDSNQQLANLLPGLQVLLQQQLEGKK